MSPRRGFTLIELLVVIAIIGMLSSVVLASLTTARNKAADTRRMAGMKSLQAALELYYLTYGAYPVANWYSSEVGDANSNNGGNWIPGLAPTYIAQLPKDPQGGNSTIPGGCAATYKKAYMYYSDGLTYLLASHCAPSSFPSVGAFYDPLRPVWAYKICGGKDAETCVTSW